MSPKTWREKDGRPIHDGDCWFWDKEICTCGLIHHISWVSHNQEKEWFGKEWGMHDRQVHRVPDPLPWKEPSDEEVEARTKQILEDVFGKDKRSV